MNRIENGVEAVSDHGLQSCTKEKVKRSVLGSCKAEVESVAGKENPSPKVSTCNICFRSFGCGKALGGHRRSHFLKQQKKVKICSTDNQSSKPGDNNIRANCDFDDDGGKHICCICKKEFPTKNALFGHMRSHPERPWRGVSPPIQKHSSSPSSYYYYSSSYSSINSDSMEKNKEDHDVDDDCGGGERVIAPDEHHTDVIDLSALISPSWLKKDIRGRSSIGGYQAAETLFYMCGYSKFFRSESNRVFPKKDEVLPKSTPSLIKERKRKNGESSSSKKDKVKKIRFLFKGELQLVNKTDGVGEFDDGGNELNKSKGSSESGVEYNHDEKKIMDEGFDYVNAGMVNPTVQHVGPSTVKKGKNSRKLVLNSRTKDSESENVSQEKEDKYKCTACGKGFPTFQGLGGHRSIHKEKNIVSIDESSPLEAVAEQNNSSSSSNMQKMEEPLLNEATLAQQPCQSSGVKTLNFDLNELPSATEED
ncbi:unnamed protein product [Sphenostylis stenocarpa]|uniref:C2H2-type domain-containing protein n=1 Tax=Sphenostylis stenocarpa TaxID=92480 RepID=A0AA86SUP1_9FABA|nr:unnamed protein product [Sphenostylis stenocarpa]